MWRSAPVEICTTTTLQRPSVIGFLKPRILIPDWLFARLTAGELEQIVLHEAEHLRRRDDWTNLLQKLCLVLFPLNPALVWIERRLCREREMACDEGVIKITHAPRAYASCLARLAERGLNGARRRFRWARGSAGRNWFIGCTVFLRQQAHAGSAGNAGLAGRAWVRAAFWLGRAGALPAVGCVCSGAESESGAVVADGSAPLRRRLHGRVRMPRRINRFNRSLGSRSAERGLMHRR